LNDGSSIPAPPRRRIDQWLWFARLVRTRSSAARLCAAGKVTLNGVAVRKPNHAVRLGDAIGAPQGAYQRTVRVLALGLRRGPASEARLLYEEIAVPLRLSDLMQTWEPILADGEPEN
jgi:ribosome-associated heat shock protein Hsp15